MFVSPHDLLFDISPTHSPFETKCSLEGSVAYAVLRTHWFAYGRHPILLLFITVTLFSTVDFIFCLENRANRFLRNVCNDLRDYTASWNSILLTAVNLRSPPEARRNKTD